ncbi:MAG: DUF5615 family PIN-like protein [Pirellulales bacterium]
MSDVRFFTDEDVYGVIAPILRRAGFDDVSTPEAGRLRPSDESQLIFATAEGRIFVTFNVAHFAAMHSEWMRQNRHHAGIALSYQRPIGEVLRRLLHLGNTLDANAMQDRLEFLSD